MRAGGARTVTVLAPLCCLRPLQGWDKARNTEGTTMKRNIRIREVRREEIDLQKLAAALLRLAREQAAERAADVTDEAKHE